MTKEEKHELFLKYVENTGVKLESWGKQLGYAPSTMSNFKRGACDVPDSLAWGLSYALAFLDLQSMLGK